MPATPRRAYDSPVRRQRAEQTRERILAAGSELAHEFASWDWQDLTFRAVAERAGVGLRTVYRYFPTERQLHDAIMERLEADAGVTYEDFRLDDVATVATAIFSSLSQFSVGETVRRGSSEVFLEADVRRRGILLAGLAEEAPGWSTEQREAVAALLDVLWNPPTFERLTGAWGFETDRASEAISWLIRLVLDEVRDGEPPATASG